MKEKRPADGLAVKYGVSHCCWCYVKRHGSRSHAPPPPPRLTVVSIFPEQIGLTIVAKMVQSTDVS